MKKTIILLIVFILCLSFFGCVPLDDSGNTDGDNPNNGEYGIYVKDDYKYVDKTRMFGIAEPFYEKKQDSDTFQVKSFDADITIDLLKELGVKTIRLMLPQKLFTKYAMYGEGDFEVELDENIVSYFKTVIKKLNDNGVTHIICEAPIYPKPLGFDGGYLSLTVPRRNDDVYRDWCLLMEEQWRIIASTFTEIRYFEIGNETNAHGYMSAINNERLSLEEISAINTDMFYYATRGVKRANPNAYTCTAGFTSLGTMNDSVATTLTEQGYSINSVIEKIYQNIASGSFPYGQDKSTKIDDYFNVIAIHPYQHLTWDDFVSGNQSFFELVNRYDNGRKVFVTEIGWPDYFDQDKTVEIDRKIIEMYEYYKTVPQVESVCYFRLYDCEYASVWGSVAERTFGLFKEPNGVYGFLPKNSATLLKNYFKSDGDIFVWSDAFDLYNYFNKIKK